MVQTAEAKESENKLTILQGKKLPSISLLRYLEQRKIPLDIAGEFCSEVSFKLEDKFCFGTGFKNDSGGYEIPEFYFKSSSSSKDVTTIKNNSDEVKVFEGFFNFFPSKPQV